MVNLQGHPYIDESTYDSDEEDDDGATEEDEEQEAEDGQQRTQVQTEEVQGLDFAGIESSSHFQLSTWLSV